MKSTKEQTIWTPEFRAAYDFVARRTRQKPQGTVLIVGPEGSGKSHLIKLLQDNGDVAEGWRVRDKNESMVGIEFRPSHIQTTRDDIEQLSARTTQDRVGKPATGMSASAKTEKKSVEIIELPQPDYEIRLALVRDVLDSYAVKSDAEAQKLLAEVHETDLTWVLLAATRVARYARLHMRYVDMELVAEVLKHEIDPKHFQSDDDD